MSHYKPYPAYKDSGVEWIGPIPHHWEVVPIKRASRLRNDRRSEAPADWTYIGLEDVEPEFGRYVPKGTQSRQSEDSMVGAFQARDVLYGKLRPYLRKAIVAERDGICSTEFLVIETLLTEPDWLHGWLLTPAVTQQIESGCDGAKMPRADWGHVGSIALPLPPRNEQIAIAVSLERETSRIDALIAKKTEFLALLTKKRLALITNCVTKGLDPNVKMKESGVEWIGEVPEHWRVGSLGYMARVATGGTPDRKIESYWNGEIPWVKTGEVNYEAIHDTEERITEAGCQKSAAFVAETGTILMAMYGMGVTRGRVAILGIPAAFNQACAAISCGQECDNRYVFYCLTAAYKFIRDLGNEASQVNLNLEIVSKLKLPVPPMEEQRDVVKQLEAQIQKVSLLENRVERSLALLKDRRSALITAAVTGQIDLREPA